MLHFIWYKIKAIALLKFVQNGSEPRVQEYWHTTRLRHPKRSIYFFRRSYVRPLVTLFLDNLFLQVLLALSFSLKYRKPSFHTARIIIAHITVVRYELNFQFYWIRQESIPEQHSLRHILHSKHSYEILTSKKSATENGDVVNAPDAQMHTVFSMERIMFCL